MRSDIEIRKDVTEELEWDAVINAYATKPAEIGVAVKNGIVTLTGTVDKYIKKTSAERAAMKVAGVKAIANDIDVKLSDWNAKNDTEIAEVILSALKWNTSLPEDKIKVIVEHGWVTLEGKVEWGFQRDAATSAIEYLIGVKGINNRIEVVSILPTPDSVKNKITSAFLRNHYLDANKIRVEVNGDTAVLKGQLGALSEKIAAENAAWSAPGISKVENKLEVDYSSVLI